MCSKHSLTSLFFLHFYKTVSATIFLLFPNRSQCTIIGRKITTLLLDSIWVISRNFFKFVFGIHQRPVTMFMGFVVLMILLCVKPHLKQDFPNLFSFISHIYIFSVNLNFPEFVDCLFISSYLTLLHCRKIRSTEWISWNNTNHY